VPGIEQHRKAAIFGSCFSPFIEKSGFRNQPAAATIPAISGPLQSASPDTHMQAGHGYPLLWKPTKLLGRHLEVYRRREPQEIR
jgi:hypothetical protein